MRLAYRGNLVVGKITVLKNRSENTQNEAKRNKKVENEERHRGNVLKRFIIYVESQKKREKESSIFEEIMSENLPKLIKDFTRFKFYRLQEKPCKLQ